MKVEMKEEVAKALSKALVYVVIVCMVMLFVLLISMAGAYKIAESVGTSGGFSYRCRRLPSGGSSSIMHLGIQSRRRLENRFQEKMNKKKK